MNDHLTPVFKIVLPALHNANLRYWVYGGVSIAGINGQFLRRNPDIDLFVMEADYETITETIAGLESELGWRHEDDDSGKRKKRDWFVQGEGQDILSVVPIFEAGDQIRFVFGRDSYTPKSVLTSKVRIIDGFSFVTPRLSFNNRLVS
jgi:hypothetical protein